MEDAMDEFWGFEFDWFAIDSAGNIGLFCFGGFGFIPPLVLAHHEAHTQLTRQLELPNYGSEQVWKDYAKQGLFVYDWKVYDGPFIRMAEPTCKLVSDLKEKILQIEGLPVIRQLFPDTQAIHTTDL